MLRVGPRQRRPPRATLDEAVAEFIAPIKDKSALIMQITKLTVNRGLDGDTETLIALESMTCNVIHQSEDAREGVQPSWRSATLYGPTADTILLSRRRPPRHRGIAAAMS